ncbi:copper transporter [Yimella sp. NH-Cas1]|uniref:copper transporter n=1 Tax=Yimella sp. NH-Cas1 TaxID=2917726 RepID=UPI001EFB2FA1|nr:copper transporter [Yimella sp. NH-Cas1]
MIDFRYHVVSLVAVFLALATGIIIGGFSLRGEVADQLNGQVVSLRKDKAELQNQVNQGNASSKKRDDGVAQLAPSLLAGKLTGRQVAIVVLPGVDDSLVTKVRRTVTDSDGKVATTVTLDDKWTGSDYADSATMRDYAAKVALDPRSVKADRLGGAVLARALTRGDAGARGVLDKLADSDATTVEPSDGPAASAIVVVWPGMVDKDGQAKRWAAVVSGLGISVDAVVGVSSGSASTNDGLSPDALMTRLRDTPDVVSVMSTVDNGSLAIGQVAVGLCLRDELAGRSGQYGMGRDASAMMPQVEPSAEAQ